MLETISKNGCQQGHFEDCIIHSTMSNSTVRGIDDTNNNNNNESNVYNNGSLLPYHNWTISEYAMPDMPSWIPISYLILLCVAIVVGIPGNSITALAYFCVKLKTNCDWYIFFVAVFDLTSCTFRVTGYLFEFLGIWTKLTNNAYCLFVSWVSQTSVGMSIFIVGLIAIDRCIKVSFNSRMTISPTQSRNICLIFTVLAFLLGSPTLFIYGNTPRGICIVTRDSSEKPWVKIYYSTIFLLLFGMMAAVIFCYLSIAWTVMKNRRSIKIMPTYSTNRATSTSRRRKHQQQPEVMGYRRTDELENNRVQFFSCVPSTSHPNHDDPNIVSGGSGPSLTKNRQERSSINTLSLIQVPKLFIIPGPQTKAIILPQPSPNRTARTAATSNAATTTTNTSILTANTIEAVDNTELNLENVTEMNTRSSDESIRIRIQFSKEQWNKRLARDYKVTGLLFLVTTMFILSWIAPIYATFRAFFVGIVFPFTVEDAIVLIYAPNLYIIHNFVNPLIYLALSASYRKKVHAFYERCVKLVCRLKFW